MKGISSYLKLWALALLCICTKVAAQETLIGKPAPQFSLLVKNGTTGKSSIKTLDSYRGKWLIMDFWSKTCVLCIASFPKMDSLRQKYGKQISFLAVGINDKQYNSGIAEMYHKIARSAQLKLDIAFDSTLVGSYQIKSFPNVVVIDPKGIVRAVTYSSELSPARLEEMIHHDRYLFAQQSPIQTNVKACNFSDTTGQIAYQSQLHTWKSDELVRIRTDFESLKNGYFQTSAIPLGSLYLMAYFGRADWTVGDSLHTTVSRYPILQLSDKSPFVPHMQQARGLYRYRLQLTGNTSKSNAAMSALRQDLERCFGYKVSISQQPTTVWELVVINPDLVAKLRAKGQQQKVTGDHGGLHFYHVSIKTVLQRIHYYHPKNIYLDRSHCNMPVDISLNVPLISFEEINTALKKQGLALKKTKLPIKTLVISD